MYFENSNKTTVVKINIIQINNSSELIILFYLRLSTGDSSLDLYMIFKYKAIVMRPIQRINNRTKKIVLYVYLNK